MTNREILESLDYEDLIVFDNPDYDGAIIGVSEDNRVVYDYDKMIDHLVSHDGMTTEDAADFIGYNTIRSLPYAGPHAPIIMYDIRQYQYEEMEIKQ